MDRIAITLACGPYDRTEALRNGAVTVEGVKLTYITLPPEEIFWRMVRYREFHASEMSMCNHIMLTARGDCPFVAIPVFPSRMFRHSSIFVNARSGIHDPRDLIGKRVGTPEYHMTAGLWIRGILKDEYGVRPEDMHWVFAGLESPGRRDRLEFKMPPGVSWEVRSDRTLNDMLVRGEIDALFTARAPSAFVQGSPEVRRLFPDPFSVEVEYYKRTGLFPIMHTVVIRKDVHEAYPWLARSLMKAFEKAKALALQGLWDTATLKCTIPWLIPVLEQHRAVFGNDWWPYGVEANRRTLETMIRYAYEQRLIDRTVEVDALFAPSTLEAHQV